MLTVRGAQAVVQSRQPTALSVLWPEPDGSCTALGLEEPGPIDGAALIEAAESLVPITGA